MLKPEPVTRKARRTRIKAVPLDAQRILVDEMARSENRTKTARALASRFGLKSSTVLSGWQRWSKNVGAPVNGTSAPEPEVMGVAV